jgi:hypothetical protein
MQCACAILSSVFCLAVQYFFTLSHKRHDFGVRGEELQDMGCMFDFFYLLCLKHFSFYEEMKKDMTKKCMLVYMWSTRYIGLHVKYPLCWSTCVVPIMLVYMWSTRYIGLRVKYPLCWSTCEVPVMLVYMWSTRYIVLHVKYPLFLFDFYKILIFFCYIF